MKIIGFNKETTKGLLSRFSFFLEDYRGPFPIEVEEHPTEVDGRYHKPLIKKKDDEKSEWVGREWFILEE